MQQNDTNLLTLAAYLDTVREKNFGMSTFFVNADDEDLEVYEEPEHNCGTAACAVGHAPNAGFPILEKDANWFEYSERVFGVDPDSNEWNYLFSGSWVNADDTAKGAAARIYERWCAKNKLRAIEAEELLVCGDVRQAPLTADQREWLEDFISRWNIVADAVAHLEHEAERLAS